MQQQALAELLLLITLIGVILPILLSILASKSSVRVLWAFTRVWPISELAPRLLLRRLKRGEIDWGQVEGCTWRCPQNWAARAVDTLLDRGFCPSAGVISALVERGMLDQSVRVYRMGCAIPQEYTDVFNVIASLYGLKQFPPGSYGIVLCRDGRIEALINGEKVLTSHLPPSLASAVNPREALSRLSSKIPVFTYGCMGSPGISLERLSALILPESAPSLESLRYHLNVDESDPLDATRHVFMRLAWLALKSPREWTVGDALTIAQYIGVEGPECPSEDMLTDIPRYGCPYFSPYSIGDTDALPPTARIIAEGLKARRANPLLAAIVLLKRGLEEEARHLLSVIEATPWPPIREPMQVEPWYLQCYPRMPSHLRCLRPTIDCRAWSGAGPAENSLSEYGFEVDYPECMKRSPNIRLLEALASSVRLRPKLSIAEGENQFVEIVKAALVAAAKQDNPALVVVPNSLMASSIMRASRALGIKSLRVVEWAELSREPWNAEGDRSVILVLPEKYEVPGWMVELLRKGRYDLYRKVSIARILELGGMHRAVVVSPALQSVGADYEVYSRSSELGDLDVPWPRVQEALREAMRLFRRLWGARFKLRPYQEYAIGSIWESAESKPGRPVFSVFPTGSGKSAVFQLSGSLLTGVEGGYTLVISPLRALIRDQVESLLRRGIPAAKIDATVRQELKREILDLALAGLLEFLYVTPERFNDESFASKIASSPPTLAVLDEAHTVVKWGTSFRPSYLYAARYLGDLRRTTGYPHIALFTASAAGELALSVFETLGIKDGIVEVQLDWEGQGEIITGDWKALIIRLPTIRSNIRFEVTAVPEGEDRLEDLVEIVKSLSDWSNTVSDPWLGVVFTSYVKSEKNEWANADNLAKTIAERTGIPSISYHGQLPSSERRRRENAIYKASLTGEGPRIIVATKAFGMGVDLPNIRWILHVLPSDSIEDYYQEAGRAGRDGLSSRALHFYNPIDFEEKKRLVLKQRIRPSSVVRTLNTIAYIHEQATRGRGGWTEIVLPLEALPSKTVALKSIDVLRSLGLIDYWILSGRIGAYQAPMQAPEGMPTAYDLPWFMDLGKGIIVGPRLESVPVGWKRLPLNIYKCSSYTEQAYPFRLKAGPVEVKVGDCTKWEAIPVSTLLTIVVVVPSSEGGLKPASILNPTDYAYVMRLYLREERGIKEYADLMQEAAALTARYGLGSNRVDSMIKQKIDEYLSTPLPGSNLNPPEGLLSSVVSCPTASDCIGKAVDKILLAERWLGGPEAVTLAVQDENVLQAILEKYKRRTGEPFNGRSRKMYEAVMRRSRLGWHSLLDLGFIVVVAQGRTNTLRALQRLEGYPYSALLVYNIR